MSLSVTKSFLLLVALASTPSGTSAFVPRNQPDGQRWHFPHHRRIIRTFSIMTQATNIHTTLYSTNNDDDNIERTSFDQAGKSLIDEEDKKRLAQMGDYDSNPNYQTDNIDRMRAAIRERTEKLGLEKSKVSQEYIQRKAAAASAAGSARAASESSTQFGGLDLSQISDQVKATNSDWNEDMPTLFYDPEAELSKEEQEEVDPIMTKNVIEQSVSELQNAKWPNFLSAFREVVLMLGVIAVTAVIIIGWDRLLRTVYMDVGFIPTPQELANYASRFDGLELPKGWTDNMSSDDIDKLGSVVNQQTTSSGIPGL